MAPLDGPAPLALVSGPAGSGKTTLLDEWCARADDEARCRIGFEDDDTLLWQPVLRSMTNHGLAVGDLLRRLGDDVLLGVEGLAALVDAVSSSGRRWTLVLDGYELTSRALADELATLIARTGDGLRIVLATRVDPVLPLYRYRLDGRLDEVRAADLAFTDAEAAALLQRCGASLAPDAAHELNVRLGGWAAGLRFAARALAGHPRPADVIESLLLNDVDITEYLLREVLDTREPETRDLLLHTCVPDVLEPDLLEDLVGADDARRLGALARSNLFLEPSAQDGCLRYHPFFRDLLRARLGYEDPETSAELHRRVAAWLRRQERWERSAAQLADGGLWAELADQLVEDLLVARILVGQDARLVTTARRIPSDLLTPAAYVVRAALALASGDSAECAEQLEAARRTRAMGSDDPGQALSLLLVEAVRAASADDLADAAEAVTRTARVLTTARRPAARLASPEIEGLVQLATARVALRGGRLERARVALARAEALPGLPARFRADVVGTLALAEGLDGHLTLAHRRASEAVAAEDDARVPGDARSPAARAALALVALERDDLTAVRRHLGETRVCRGLVDDRVSRAVAAGIQAHLGAAADATGPLDADTLLAAEDVRDPWLVGWLRLQAAEIAVACGRPEDALQALDSITDGPGPSGDVVAAAAYAEQGRSVALGRTLAHARRAARPVVPEVHRLLVEAVHEADRHSLRSAAPLLEQALELAARESARRPFREASPSVRRVLDGSPQLVARHAWLRGEAAASTPAPPLVDLRPDAAPAAAVFTGGQLIEPLTPKELEVLGHLEELLTTQEIAEKMFVSVNTVRTHVRSILRKLGVNRRNKAVRQARALGLLGAPIEVVEPITPEG